MKAPRIDDLVQDERLASQYLVADFMRYSIGIFCHCALLIGI